MIEIQKLTKTYGRTKILNKLDLTIDKGFLTIFGQNGCGKTTLLKILSTLIRKSSGTITIDDLDLEEDGIEIRKKIGYIGHEIYLYDDLTAMENLKFYANLYGIPDSEFKGKAHELLDRFNLLHRMNDYVRVYSRGMKQRLSIARAILHEPTILLLDEPYTGLDQKARDVLDEVLFTNTEEKIIVMTTHNIERLNLSERIAILSKGKIVYDETSDQMEVESFKAIYNRVVEGK
jgi:ABC-type multidrug transport system ATPase subunit